MEKIAGKLTVFYDDPFWVGVIERVEKDKLSVCRVVFGAEPKDYEVYDFILKNYNSLKFSSEVRVDIKKEKTNPKRLQREARKQSKQIGVSSKSQRNTFFKEWNELVQNLKWLYNNKEKSLN